MLGAQGDADNRRHLPDRTNRRPAKPNRYRARLCNARSRKSPVDATTLSPGINAGKWGEGRHAAAWTVFRSTCSRSEIRRLTTEDEDALAMHA
jgi:hypothetical protein